MAVNNLLTSLENFNGLVSFVSNNARYGGGQGASVNTDIIREGTQSGGRRSDNTTTGGLGVNFAATNLAGQHVKAWIAITQWAQLNSANLVIASGSTSNAGDLHSIPTADWPVNGGFIPVHVEVSRTAEAGGPANESAINEVGLQVNIGDVGGNAQNVILDSIDYGTSGLSWTGTGPGGLQDFRDYETTNDVGVFLTQLGIDFCYSRVEVGDAGGTETDFDDSNFTIAFPDQALVSPTYMGITFHLQNSNSVMALASGTIQSANPSGASRRPDLLVSGILGSLTMTAVNLLGMRLVQFTSTTTYSGGTVDTLELTQGEAPISNATVNCRAAAGVAVLDDPTPVNLTNIDWVQVGSGHAIEFGPSFAGTTVTLTRQFFDNFGGNAGTNNIPNSGSTSAALYNNSGGIINFAIVDGDVPSIRNGVGATSTAVSAKTLTFTGIPNGLEGRVRVGSISLYAESSIVGSTFQYSYDAADAGKTITVTIGGVADDGLAYDRVNREFTLEANSQTVPLAFDLNPSYSS